jgi:hypothetical protein
MDKHIARMSELADELHGLLTEAHENAKREVAKQGHWSQRELRRRFNRLVEINAEMGRIQVEMMDDPLWNYLDPEVLESLKQFITDTIVGEEMLREVLS